MKPIESKINLDLVDTLKIDITAWKLIMIIVHNLIVLIFISKFICQNNYGRFLCCWENKSVVTSLQKQFHLQNRNIGKLASDSFINKLISIRKKIRFQLFSTLIALIALNLGKYWRKSISRRTWSLEKREWNKILVKVLIRPSTLAKDRLLWKVRIVLKAWSPVSWTWN